MHAGNESAGCCSRGYTHITQHACMLLGSPTIPGKSQSKENWCLERILVEQHMQIGISDFIPDYSPSYKVVSLSVRSAELNRLKRKLLMENWLLLRKLEWQKFLSRNRWWLFLLCLARFDMERWGVVSYWTLALSGPYAQTDQAASGRRTWSLTLCASTSRCNI